MNPKKRVLTSVCTCMLVVLLLGAHARAGTIELSLPDTSAAQGDTLWLPIYTTDVTDSGVLGYDLFVRFDSTLVAIEGATTVGSISGVWGDGFLTWNVPDGQDILIVANAGLYPLSGEGILVFIGMSVLPAAPCDSSTEIVITEAILRDDPEKPPVVTYPGALTIECTAGINATDEESQPLRIEQIGPSSLRWYVETEDGPAPDLRIYSALGRLVAIVRPQPFDEAVSYSWNGCDRSGREVAGGIYFYEIMSGERRFTGKVHIRR